MSVTMSGVDRCPALVMRLFRLKDGHCVEELSAAEGASPHPPDPFDVVIDPLTFKE